MFSLLLKRFMTFFFFSTSTSCSINRIEHESWALINCELLSWTFSRFQFVRYIHPQTLDIYKILSKNINITCRTVLLITFAIFLNNCFQCLNLLSICIVFFYSKENLKVWTLTVNIDVYNFERNMFVWNLIACLFNLINLGIFLFVLSLN